MQYVMETLPEMPQGRTTQRYEDRAVEIRDKVLAEMVPVLAAVDDRRSRLDALCRHLKRLGGVKYSILVRERGEDGKPTSWGLYVAPF